MAIDPERQKRTMATLAASRHDAVICWAPTEVLLLTGYWPVMGSSLAIFTASGEVKVIVPEDEVELAEKTSSAEIVPYKPAGLHTLASPLQLLKEPLGCVVKDLSQPREDRIATVSRCSAFELCRFQSISIVRARAATGASAPRDL